MAGVEDAIVCNNEKLASGSTASFVRSCKHFLDWQIFQEGTDWPSLIMAPSNMVNSETAANLAIEARNKRVHLAALALAFHILRLDIPYARR